MVMLVGIGMMWMFMEGQDYHCILDDVNVYGRTKLTLFMGWCECLLMDKLVVVNGMTWMFVDGQSCHCSRDNVNVLGRSMLSFFMGWCECLWTDKVVILHGIMWMFVDKQVCHCSFDDVNVCGRIRLSLFRDDMNVLGRQCCHFSWEMWMILDEKKAVTVHGMMVRTACNWMMWICVDGQCCRCSLFMGWWCGLHACDDVNFCGGTNTTHVRTGMLGWWRYFLRLV